MPTNTLESEKNQTMILSQVMAIGQAIQQDITSHPQAVYQLIVEAVCQVTGADCAVIYPYHPSFGEFYDLDNIATYGLHQTLQLDEKLDRRRGLTARVHQEREIICEDTAQDPKLIAETPFIDREEIKAFMGLSLRVDDIILGIFYVDYREPHYFSDSEKDVIRLFGQQASTALSNAWSFRLAKMRAGTVSNLKRVGQSLAAIKGPTGLAKTLAEVLEKTARSALEVLDASMVDLYQYIQARDEFVLPPILVGSRRYPDLIPHQIYSDDVVVKAVTMGKPQYFPEAQQDPVLVEAFQTARDTVPEQRFVIREEVASSAIVPLIAAGETVGVMFVSYRMPQLFSAEQQDIIETFAAQAAVAIYNTRLFRRERERRHQSETLREVARIVNTTLDRDQAVELVLDQLYQVIEYDSASIQLIQGDRRRLIGGRGRMAEPNSGLLRNISQDPLIRKVIDNKAPLVLSDVSQEPLWDNQFPETQAINSWLGVPLLVGNQIVGLLTVDHNQAGYYTEETGQIAAIFANHAALAIRNAELFSLQQRRSRDLEILNQAALKLTATLEAEEAYQAILEAVVDTLHCDYCTIFVAEPDKTLVSRLSGGKLFVEIPRLQFAPGEGLAGWVYQQNRSLIVNNTAEHSRYKLGPKEEAVEPRSIILSPLRRGEKPIGVVSADFDHPNGFDQNDLRLLDTLTLYAGTVLENIEFFNDFQVLHNVANQLARQRTLAQIYQTAVEAARKTLHCSHSTIFSVDRKTGRLVAQARAGSSQTAPAVRSFKLGEGLIGTVAQTGRSLLVNDTTKDDRFVEGKVKPQFAPQSMILAPVKIDEEVVGVISADKDETGGFTPHNLEVLETLALDIGIAINLRRQQDRLRAIAEFQQTVSDILTVPAQLEQIYENIAGLVDASSMYIGLYDESSGLIEFPLAYERGQFVEDAVKVEDNPYAPRPFSTRRGLTEWVIRHKKPLLVEDSDTWPAEQAEIEAAFLQKIKCCLVVPVLIQNRIVGVIGLQNFDHPGVFDQADRDLLVTIANQTAIAIENARLYDQIRTQVERLATLYEIGRRITATLERDKILASIAEEVVNLVDADRSLFLLVDLANEHLVKVEGYNYPKEHLQSITLEQVKSGVSGWVLDHKEPALVADAQSDPRNVGLALEKAKAFGTVPLLVAPLIIRGQVKGTLTAANRAGAPAFTDEDLKLVTMLANQAAIALDNADLHYNLSERVKELSALTEVGQELTAGLRLKEPEVLDLIYAEASKLMLTDNMYIALHEEETDIVRFGLVMEKGERIPSEELQPGGKYEPRSGGAGKTEAIIHTRESIFHNTQAQAKAWYAQPEHKEYVGRISGSWIGVPMMAGEKVLGVIAAYHPDLDNVFDENDLQVLQILASQAAIALDNARLYYEANLSLEEANRGLERRVEMLRAVNEVSQTLTSGLRLKETEILELIYKQTHQLTGAKDMYIALYDDATQVIRFPLAMESGALVQIAEPRQVNMEKRGKTEEVIFTRQPLLHRTKEEAKNWYNLAGHQEFIGKTQSSYLGVPMIVGEKVLGMIAAYDWDLDNVYDENDLQVLQILADQAAIALDNASLYYEVNRALELTNRDLQRRIDSLSTLNEFARQLTSDLRQTQDAILELIYQQILELTHTENIYVALYDERSGRIEFRLLMERGVRLPAEERPGFRSRQLDATNRGKTDEVILTGAPILHETRAEEIDWYNQAGHREYTDGFSASHLAVPMLIGSQVIGVIAVYDWDREYAYDEQDVEVVTTMASQAAIALENARLFAERGQRLELLQEISARMVQAGLEPDEVLELVAKAINDLTQSDLTAIYLYNQEGISFARGVQVRQGEKVQQIDHELPDPKDLPIPPAQDQPPVFIDDVRKYPETFSFARRHNLQAFAGLPLTTTGFHGLQTTVGVLFVNFKQKHLFSDDEQEILRHLANQAAVAIAFAGAQESAQAKEQLAALGTAAATLQHRLGNTINVILPAVMRLRLRVGQDTTNKDILDTIERNALFATEVIRRMQTPLRQEAFVRTDINSLLHEAVQKCLQDKDRFPNVRLVTDLPDLTKTELLPSTASEQQIKIVASLDEQLPKTYASIGQMTEVFRVLVENGIKAIYPHSGTVTVTSRLKRDRSRPCIDILVSDTGKGIDDKTRSKLFKQPVPRKEFGQGAGLGLWLSHIIVRSHQGSLTVESTMLHEGSTFLVRLPVLDQAPPNETSIPGGGE